MPGATASDTRPYVLISADTHAGASVEGYRAYLDAEHQQLFDAWRSGYKNPQRQHIGSKKHKNWDDAERLHDMETEGVVGEIVFPNTVPPFFKTSVLICGNPSREDYPRRLAGIRAHNRWLVDWCAEHPERRAGIGLVYLNDIDEAIADVKWIAEHGLRGGVLLPHVPPDCTHILPLYAPDLSWVLRLPPRSILQDLGAVSTLDERESGGVRAFAARVQDKLTGQVDHVVALGSWRADGADSSSSLEGAETRMRLGGSLGERGAITVMGARGTLDADSQAQAPSVSRDAGSVGVNVSYDTSDDASLAMSAYYARGDLEVGASAEAPKEPSMRRPAAPASATG